MAFSQNPYYSHLTQSGGGGFVNESPAEGVTPGGTRKFGQTTSLRPVTTHQLLTQVQKAHGDADFSLDGIELGPISLVAILHGIKVQATNTVFTLHDGWGQVEARTWKDGDVDVDDEEENHKADGLVEGRYVYVVGNLKSLHNRQLLNITSIRPVKNFNEVLHHQLEVISAFLYNTRGPNAAKGAGAKEQEDVVMHNASAYQAGGGGGGGDSRDDLVRGLTPFHRAVFEAIRKHVGHKDGVHVGMITRELQSSLRGEKPTPKDISDAFDALMDQGIIYSTIDESHYDLAD